MSNTTSSLSFIYVLDYDCLLTVETFPKIKSFFESAREAGGSMICRKDPGRMFCVASFLSRRQRSVMLNCLVVTKVISALLQLRFCEDSFCIKNLKGQEGHLGRANQGPGRCFRHDFEEDVKRVRIWRRRRGSREREFVQ